MGLSTKFIVTPVNRKLSCMSDLQDYPGNFSAKGLIIIDKNNFKTSVIFNKLI